nr:YabP/YqfC family sporulation protein [uncultured Dysosmobacter sp.]
MERNRRDREGGVLSAVAELFDLPADVVAGLPRLEMVGSRQLYLEHHTGILAYSQEQIDANTAAGVLRVRGERLTLLAMTAGELRIGGKIDAVEWVGVDGC